LLSGKARLKPCPQEHEGDQAKEKAARVPGGLFVLYIQNIKLEGWQGQIKEISIYRGMRAFGGKGANRGLDRVSPKMGIGWG